MKNNIDNKNVVPHHAVHLTTIDMPHLCLRTAFGKELLSYHFRETWVAQQCWQQNIYDTKCK